jgi:hypothetical protein
MAVTFRLPNERLLDNDVHLKASATAAAARLDFVPLRLRPIPGTIADSSAFVAAVAGRTATYPTVVAKFGAVNTWHVTDLDRLDGTGGPAEIESITSDVCGAARDGWHTTPAGVRIVAIGTGGNRCCQSTDEGQTWTAGDDLGATPQAITYNETHGVFMVTFASGVNVAVDDDSLSTWASASTGLASAQGGIAVLANGDTVVAGLTAGAVDFAVSADGGATWSVAGGTVPDFGEYEAESGYVAGNNGAAVYHAGRALGGTEIRVCSSADGAAWSLLATIEVPSTVGDIFDSQPRLIMCPTTGLLVLVGTLSTAALSVGTAFMCFSVDGGATWSPVGTYRFGGVSPVTAWAVAGGRIFLTAGTNIYASDRIM